jgi:hypothetical protein
LFFGGDEFYVFYDILPFISKQEMLSKNAIVIGITSLLILLGLFLMPAYEHFKSYYIEPHKLSVKDYKPTDPLPTERMFPSDDSYLGKYLPSWLRNTEAFVDKIPSKLKLIPPVSVPEVDLSSTLGTTPGAVGDALSASHPPSPIPDSDYVKKSSVVPCAKTRFAAPPSIPKRSVVPGEELTHVEDQFNVLKPFNIAFTRDTDQPQPFLNSFNAFTR